MITEVISGQSYRYAAIEQFAQNNDLNERWSGDDMYSEGSPSEFLALDDENGSTKNRFVHDGHIDSSGAVYKCID